MSKLIDMTGWIMSEHGVPDSRLIVIEYCGNGKWLCECTCKEHNKITVSGKSLRIGNTKSCGCLHKEQSAINGKKSKKYNQYDLSGDYGIGYCINTMSPFYFDLEDYDKIKDYCWHERVSNGYHTVQSVINGKNVKMHQLISENGIDHIDRNPLNNRKNNLRNSTHIENCRNRGVRTDNKSGIIGVSWDNRDSCWKSQIQDNGCKKHLGMFENKEDAIRARLEAEAKYFGDFAPQRHLFEQYKINVGG